MERHLAKLRFDFLGKGLLFIFAVSTCGTLLAENLDVYAGLPNGDITQSTACDYSCDDCLPPPMCPWYIRSEAMFLRRDRIDTEYVASLNDPNNIVFATSNLDTPMRAGAKIVLGHTFSESGWQLDFTYFGVDSWVDSATIRDSSDNDLGSTGNLTSRFSNFGQPELANFDYNNYIRIREVSELQNGELNLRYIMPMQHTMLVPKFIIGIRYMSINENFDYYSESSEHTAVSLGTRTTNDLFGPQLGLEFTCWACKNAWVEFGIKGAVCNNNAMQETVGTATSAVNVRDSRNTTSYVGDADLLLVWQITPHLLTRIGYQAMVVTNIAMGARNYAPSADTLQTNTPYIDTDGNAVYHGPHIGMEVTW